MSRQSRRTAGRVPLLITLSADDYQFAERALSADDSALDEFFMAAIDALRLQVQATREFLDRTGLAGADELPPLEYKVVVRAPVH